MMRRWSGKKKKKMRKKKKTREGHSKQEKKQSTGDRNELSMLLEQSPAEWGWSNVGRRGWRKRRCER